MSTDKKNPLPYHLNNLFSAKMAEVKLFKEEIIDICSGLASNQSSSLLNFVVFNFFILLLVDVDTVATDLSFLIKGVNDMRKEIEVVEKIKEQKELYDDYLESLINFAADAVDDLEKLNNLFEDLSKKINVFAEKMGEKKNTKLKELLLPITSFFRFFKN